MITKSIFQFIISCLFVLTGLISYGQTGESNTFRFVPYENQLFGFDANLISEWKESYDITLITGLNEYPVAYKSVVQGYTDSVDIVIPDEINYSNLSFVVEDSTYQLECFKRTKDTFTIVLPIINSNYSLDVFAGDKLLGSIRIVVYPEHVVNVVIVPLIRFKANSDSLETYLNRVYQQAGLAISLEVDPFFTTGSFSDSVLWNPSLESNRFTDQMVEIRDAYFEEHPDGNQTAYYVFLTNGFVDESREGYSVQNKAVSFVKKDAQDLYRTIAKELGHAIGALKDTWDNNGPEKGTTNNLMDIKGTELTYDQWESIHLLKDIISYYDDYEDIRTNSGLIAYYLWEEDSYGNIIQTGEGLKKSIARPFKRNTYSLHLDIDNFLFVQLFDILQYPICFLHILGFLLLVILLVFVRKKVVKRYEKLREYRLLRWTTRFAFFTTFVFAYIGVFLIINEGYFMYEVRQGELVMFKGMSVNDVSREIRNNKNVRRSHENNMSSEILIKKGGKWILKKRKKVLYFNLKKNKQGRLSVKLSNHSDTLNISTKGFNKYAYSHYFVFNYLDERGGLIEQAAFNHLGVEITDKLELNDPAERILLFVNGYRPTSIGDNFEKNFDDILKKGFEFPNSKNLIYNNDRYSYWRPWNQIDLMFEKRLNPSETYYADGHHSVETSNHRSLIDFTHLSTTYPKRCKNPKHHICKKSKKGWAFIGLSREVNTVKLHNLKPNRKGFKQRVDNGKIAGGNFYQICNEIPNRSQNDTLYIVTHSMGYAYALGIIEKLRGKINFGGLYIVAPENAESGSVDIDEWNEVWQYGSNFEAHRLNAPCLLDGIAPQTKAGGISSGQRTYIPEENYKKMGFFNSHFIGNYIWIFDLKKGETGYINQH